MFPRIYRRFIINLNQKLLPRHFAQKTGTADDLRLKSLDFDSEDLEEIETNFMEVHKSHKQHEMELEVNKETCRAFMIQHKYFKEEKLPNFLTWSDKEQIRLLHQTNPEEWTVEVLSDSFPATPKIISKIIKATWTKRKPHKILNHDENVKKNWELFKKGEIKNLPNDLVEHLKKFTNRELTKSIASLEIPKKVVVNPGRRVGKEFSSIIESYEKLKKNDSEKVEESKENLEDLNFDDGLQEMKNPKKLVTLSQLKGVDVKKNEEEIKEVEINREDLSKIVEIQQNKKQVVSFKPKTDLSYLNYPQRILIPKEILKRGCTYKLNDCYYDSDGRFLYRVPGMDK